MLKIDIVDYDELTEEEKNGNLSNNGCGKKYAHYLRVTDNDELIALESDAMEPEDVSFVRDLRWIKDLLEKVYEREKR